MSKGNIGSFPSPSFDNRSSLNVRPLTSKSINGPTTPISQMRHGTSTSTVNAFKNFNKVRPVTSKSINNPFPSFSQARPTTQFREYSNVELKREPNLDTKNTNNARMFYRSPVVSQRT